jgi:hypothetical protein
MNNAKIAFALAPVILLAAGVSAYLARPAPAAVASGGPASMVKVVSQPGQANRPVRPAGPAHPADPGHRAVPGHAVPGHGAIRSNQAKPAAGRSSAQAGPGRFNDWLNGSGGALLKSDVAVLDQTRSDAAAHNAAAVKADGSALIAAGHAALGDPPPSLTANWDAAFGAQVEAGNDLEAGNWAAAIAESGVVKAELYAFYTQAA